jgi:hypothetical protein
MTRQISGRGMVATPEQVDMRVGLDIGADAA